ncbi:MAG: hypothetical protein OQK24_09825 [Magnetovibrio sp.]|nr:hypothetical protein [Magnetovibrio sp.]
MSKQSFLSIDDQKLGEDFLTNGFAIFDVEDTDALDRIQSCVAEIAARHLGHEKPADATTYLDQIHDHISSQSLNDLRLHVINGLKQETWFRQAYFELARKHIEALVGNELVMQRNVNLSIQLPDDDSSLLPIHADVWDGNSPFEVVVWLPLVDCYGTKTMYLLSPTDDYAMHNQFHNFTNKNAEDLYQAVKGRAQFMKVNKGQVMIFSLSLMHGNRVNLEDTTRWSMNVRFKGALTPYDDKKLGEYFEPISVRPITKLGMKYQYHQGFKDE